jgi:hypothetical protein
MLVVIMAKTGRNEPCPCGSGKKYKHCCYDKELVQSGAPESSVTDPEWLKIRRTEGEMIPLILEFAISRYGKGFFQEAFDEFCLWGEYEVDEIHNETIFLPWLAFNWIPETDPEGRVDPDAQPLGLEYLEKNARTPDRYQQAFIRAACGEPYSFFLITDVDPGKSMGIRDIFLGRTLTVKESAGSKQLKRGDVVFSRVVELEGQAIMLGMAPTMLPPPCHREILDSRDDFTEKLGKSGIKLDKALLQEYDIEMREIYFQLVELVSNPPPPELRNTDGDPLTFAKMCFKLGCSPAEALAGLKSLSLPEFQDDLLSDAVFDADGNLTEVTFSWQKQGNKSNKTWKNTILGNLTIKGDLLSAEVNSEKRAKKIRSEIEKRLKKNVHFLKAEYESIEAKLEEMKNQGGSAASEDQLREMEEFQSRPEVRELIRKQMEAHWEEWYNQRIPALDNQTPLEASQTESGRERLEALLMEYERHDERVTDPYKRVDIGAIRKRLGL